MLAEIKLGIDSVKSTMELVKAIKGVTEKAELDAALFEVRDHLANLQERLLSAQQVTDTILEERRQAIRELEDERNRNSQLDRYSLFEPRPGVFLHLFQPSEGDETPVHTACPKCFSEKTVSILQRPDPAKNKIDCPRCPFTYDPRTPEEIRLIQERTAASYRRINQRPNRHNY
jgi:hypothetical protein